MTLVFFDRRVLAAVPSASEMPPEWFERLQAGAHDERMPPIFGTILRTPTASEAKSRDRGRSAVTSGAGAPTGVNACGIRIRVEADSRCRYYAAWVDSRKQREWAQSTTFSCCSVAGSAEAEMRMESEPAEALSACVEKTRRAHESAQPEESKERGGMRANVAPGVTLGTPFRKHYSAFGSNFMATPFMQYRRPVGRGPSLNTCPR